jgi:hypothetical protein
VVACILPKASDDATRREDAVSAGEPIFTVTDKWGDVIALTQEDWDRIVTKRPGVAGYEEHVRLTLESPTMVWEGGYEDSKVFYKKGLLDEDPLYKACYVATIVRYPAQDGHATIRTVYFPFHVQAKLGKLLHVER